MADTDDDTAKLERAAALTARLRTVIAETQTDMAKMPMLVRPMARRGFAKRTGRSFAEWEAFAGDLLARLQGGPTRTRSLRPDLASQLEPLRENYRTAPERAGRFMRDDTLLALVRERSEAREQLVAALIDALRELLAN